MKRQYILILTFLVLFSNTIIIAKYQDQKKRFESYVAGSNKVLSFRNIQLNQRLLFENSPFRIDGAGGKELILLTSILHCNQCVDSIVNALNEFKAAHPGFVFRILADYESRGDLLLFKRLNKISVPVINSSELNFPILKSDIPLLFIYNPADQTATHIYAPDPQDPTLTKEYLRLVLGLLNQIPTPGMKEEGEGP
jgi:hypothetical protein